MFPELVTRPDLDLFLPPIGGASVYLFGDPARLERIRSTKMPKIDKPTLFNTPEADAICSALEVFPPDNPWNLVVEDWPLHSNSKNIVASIGPSARTRLVVSLGDGPPSRCTALALRREGAPTPLSILSLIARDTS